MIKKVSFFLVLLMSSSLFSQQSKINNYQYIIVPDKFDFVKSIDQYQTSSLTKFLLKKKGFKVFLSNENLPKELKNNRCKALQAIVKDDSSMFTIKSSIELQDCYGKVLFTSDIGKSKEKDYKKGYQEAIRNAFETMADMEYNYNPSIEVEKEVKKEAAIVKNMGNSVITTVKSTAIVIPNVKIDVVKNETVQKKAIDILYSQPSNNGFQLVNTKPEVVFFILKTNVKDVFILKDKNGIFYKIGKNWVAEYYENNQLIQKEFQVKF